MKRTLALTVVTLATLLMLGGLALADDPVQRSVKIYWTSPGFDNVTVNVTSEQPITATLITEVELRAVDGTILASQPVMEGCMPVDTITQAKGQCGQAYIWSWDLSGFPRGMELQEWMRQCWYTNIYPQPSCVAYAPPHCDVTGAGCSFSLDATGRLVIPDSCYNRLVACGTRRDENDFWYQGTLTGTGSYGRCLPFLRVGMDGGEVRWHETWR